MNLYDFSINFMAWFITLCILILPIFFLIKIIKAIARKIKMRRQRKKLHVYDSFADGWKSEWTWNEKTQLWEHPLSKKTEPVGEPYRYTANEIPKEEPKKEQTHFHHEDTTFKSKQQPEAKQDRPAKVSIVIPEKIQELINEAKREKAQKESIRRTPEPTYTKAAPPKSAPEQPKTQTKHSEYHNAYEAAPILTKNEFQNFKTLNDAASKKGYMVWSKVRLADIVTPRKDSKYMSHFGKIKSKHVDFVILDQNTKVKAVIELDDRSHDREDRKQRDEFVDTILQDCGIKIIHTRYITPNILDSI